ERNQRQVWTKNLFPNGAQAGTVLHAVDERPQVTTVAPAVVLHAPAFQQDLGSLPSRQLVVALNFLHGGRMNDRAREIRARQGVADVQPFGRGNKPFCEAVEKFLCDENAARGNAALAAGLERTYDATRHRQVEAGIFADNDRTLTPHLAGHDTIVMLGRELLNAMAYVVTAREE